MHGTLRNPLLPPATRTTPPARRGCESCAVSIHPSASHCLLVLHGSQTVSVWDLNGKVQNFDAKVTESIAAVETQLKQTTDGAIAALTKIAVDSSKASTDAGTQNLIDLKADVASYAGTCSSFPAHCCTVHCACPRICMDGQGATTVVQPPVFSACNT